MLFKKNIVISVQIKLGTIELTSNQSNTRKNKCVKYHDPEEIKDTNERFLSS